MMTEFSYVQLLFIFLITNARCGKAVQIVAIEESDSYYDEKLVTEIQSKFFYEKECWNSDEIKITTFTLGNCLSNETLYKAQKVLSDPSVKIVIYENYGTVRMLLDSIGYANATMVPKIVLPINVLSNVITDVTKIVLGNTGFGIRRAGFVFDGGHEPSEFSGAMNFMTNGIRTLQVRHDEQMFDLATRLRGTSDRLFIVALDRALTADFLDSISRVGMSNQSYTYIFFDMMSAEVYKKDYGIISGVTIDSAPPNITDAILYGQDARNVYDSFLIIRTLLDQITCGATASDTSIEGLSGTFRVDNLNVTRDSWKFYVRTDPFAEVPGYEATWRSNASPLKQFNIRNSPRYEMLSKEADNLLRLYFVMYRPYAMVKENGSEASTHLDDYEGIGVDLIRRIIVKYNFNYTIVTGPELGRMESQGKWSGALGGVLGGTVDLIVGPVTVSNARKEIVSFTHSYMVTNLEMVFRDQVDLEPILTMFQFLKPFHYTVWLTILASIFVVAIVLSVLQCLSPNKYNFSLSNSVFFSSGAIIHGVTAHQPDRNSARFVAACWYFFALMFVITFVSNYAAFRVYNRMNVQINEPKDLLLQTYYTYGVQRGTYIDGLFANSTIDFMMLLNQNIRNSENGLIKHRADGFRLAEEGRFVFITDSISAKIALKQSCKIRSSKPFENMRTSFAYTQNAPYGDKLNTAIDELIFEGEVKRLISTYVPDTVKEVTDACRPQEFFDRLLDAVPPYLKHPYNQYAIGLNETAGLYCINLLGCLLALLISLLERLFKHLCKKPDDEEETKGSIINKNESHA